MRVSTVAVTALLLLVVACSPTPGTADAGPDAAATSKTSVSCHIAAQERCVEAPAPTADQRSNLEVMCSSVSGDFKSPAACPPAGFVGRCTVTTGKEVEVRRFYNASDAAYQQDFCVNTALGTWSATF